MKKIFNILATMTLIVLAVFVVAQRAAHASSSAMLPVKAQILSAYEQSGMFAAIDMGLALAIDAPWYTYWRVAGDAGLPPVFDWSSSDNVAAVDLHWPAPKRFETMGLHSFGYDGDVLFPLRITPEKPGEDVTIRLIADLMVCDKICIPQKVEIERRFRAGDAVKESAHLDAIKKAFTSLPYNGAQDDMRIETAVLASGALSFVLYDGNMVSGDADLIVEADGVVITAPPIITPDPQDPARAIARIGADLGQDFTQSLFGKKARILFLNNGRALEQDVSF